MNSIKNPHANPKAFLVTVLSNKGKRQYREEVVGYNNAVKKGSFLKGVHKGSRVIVTLEL